MLNKIISILIEKGYQVEEKTVNKNGVIKKGIMFTGSNIAPVIYEETFNDLDIDEAVEKVIETYEKNKAPEIDINEIISKDYVLSNLNIGIQRLNDGKSYVKRECEYENIEQFLYVRINADATFKVSNELLDKLELDIDKAFEIAYENTIKNTTLLSMASLFGVPESVCPMYVLTNTYKSLGAAGILNKEILRSFAKEKNATRLYIIPSSVHEIIIVPDLGTHTPEELNDMIECVNASEVSPEEQLGDNVIVFDL